MTDQLVMSHRLIIQIIKISLIEKLAVWRLKETSAVMLIVGCRGREGEGCCVDSSPPPLLLLRLQAGPL